MAVGLVKHVQGFKENRLGRRIVTAITSPRLKFRVGDQLAYMGCLVGATIDRTYAVSSVRNFIDNFVRSYHYGV